MNINCKRTNYTLNQIEDIVKQAMNSNMSFNEALGGDSATSLEIISTMIRVLKVIETSVDSTVKQSCPQAENEDDYCVNDYAGGNVDDAYNNGLDAGYYYNAAKLQSMITISASHTQSNQSPNPD